MKIWMWVIVACLLLLAGCGGAKGYRGSFGQGPSVCLVNDDASMPDELSAQHLEELYAKSGISGRDPSLEEELKKWEHQSKFNMPIQMNKQVRAYLTYFSTERKKIISCQLARSTRYLPMIKGIFQEYGLPEDLAYLAMIESGFNPRALSSAGARGLWQFIKPTGQRYGLVINNQVDERLDPEKSTRAAARYLRDLYKQFGSWYLAAASYNCGENRVQQKLNNSRNKNFWELSANKCLPNETKNYVPQMIAAIIIAKNPQKFGFNHVPYQQPLARDQWEMAESGSGKETTAARAGVLAGAASVPAPKRGGLSVTPERRQPPPMASKEGENSGRKLKSPSPKKTRLAQRKGSTQVAQARKKGNAEIYQGSIFGAPTAPGKPKSIKSAAAKTLKRKPHLAAKNGKGKKHSAARVAKKDGATYSKAKGHKKKTSSHGKSKEAKTKSKKLILSQAR
ncbi:MAG: transglycosylase SLT domain-containing protein [Thermodesulfobacteriota bacterium]